MFEETFQWENTGPIYMGDMLTLTHDIPETSKPYILTCLQTHEALGLYLKYSEAT